MRGGTIWTIIKFGLTDISIHPPHAGRDIASIGVAATSANFNPPSPCGEGHYIEREIILKEDFNPPSPCGEGPDKQGSANRHLRFQSTLPMRGGTAQVHKIYLETYAHITKQAINRGTYSEAFKVFPHIMAYFAVFFYANLPGNLCLLPLRIIK